MQFNNYDIDWQRLVRWNVPTKLLKPKQLNWLYALIYPIVLLHAAFKSYRKAKLYEIAMNFQVCYLEAFLNDRFDFSQRRIFIEDAANEDTLYLYTRAEATPVVIGTRAEAIAQPIYTRGETNGDYTNDFVINVPSSIVFDENEMRAMVATKLSGKRYKIELF